MDNGRVPLNVLHISQSDAAGGSARSAYRIHRSLQRLGMESRMLVGQRRTDEPEIRGVKRSIPWRLADRTAASVMDSLDLQYVLYPSSFGVALDPWFRASDVVQLYNTHGSYFSHSALPLLSSLRPVVWRLSDMWSFTGHVAYSYDCERWRHGCGTCPYLGEYPALSRDTTAFLWRWKNSVYARSKLTIVTPSRWLASLASESPLLRRFSIRLIPNGVDLELFRPDDRARARKRLELDPDRHVVFFSAPNLADRRKGGWVLNEALEQLSDLDFQFIVSGAHDAEGFPRPARRLGLLVDDDPMAAAYAASDLFVLPTLAENLPNAALEALACGTPVLSFDVGGMPEAVRHLETGFLAPAGDATTLAAGIRQLLGDDELRARLSAGAREAAEREFASELEATRFSELYTELVEERRNGRRNGRR